MALDHYIPQCLTRPWHTERIGRTSLRVFDFESKLYTVRNSDKLFAKRRINALPTEQFLNKYIETPFATAQDAIRAAAPDVNAMKAAFAKLPASALVGLFWLQIQRITDATEPRTEHHIDELVKKGPEWLEKFAAVVFEDYEPQLYVVTEALYFPESAFFAVPMIGELPVFALPIDTALALVFAPRAGNRRQLDELMLAPGKAMACSLTISPRVRRVLIPPELTDLPKPERLVTVREAVRKMFGVYNEVEAAVGLAPRWKLND